MSRIKEILNWDGQIIKRQTEFFLCFWKYLTVIFQLCLSAQNELKYNMIKNIIIIVFFVDKIMQLGLLKYNANLLKQVYSRADFLFFLFFLYERSNYR